MERDTTVHGEVADGFEPVRTTFEQIAATGQLGDGGAAYAAVHEGRLVADLWTGMADARTPWGRDTRNTWMSTTKAMTAIVAQVLHDRGRLDLDATVASYWPDFGAAGKQAVTVRQVLAHTSGVLGSPEITELFDLDAGKGLERKGEILDALTRAEPLWEPGTRTAYHNFTYSWIVGELVERIDGRTLGAFFRDEVAGPLGTSARIGTPVEHQDGLTTIHHLMTPPGTPELVREYTELLLSTSRDPSTPGGIAFTANGEASVLDRLPEAFNRPEILATETGGAGMTATARDVARIMAALVEPDGLDGVRLASPESLKTFSEVQTDQVDEVLFLPINRALGYWRNIPVPGRPQACGPNEETVLHTGMGGQLGFADPVARVGGAFTRNHYTNFQVEGLLMNNALYGCLS